MRVLSTLPQDLRIWLVACLAACFVHCSEATDGGPVDDAGVGLDMGGASCPASLPLAASSCTDPSCSATTGTRTFAQSELASSTSTDWLIISVATSEVDLNTHPEVTYRKAIGGGLLAGGAKSEERGGRVQASAQRLAKLAAESRVRRLSIKGPIPAGSLLIGTAIAARRPASLPPSASLQQTACTASNASICGATALCRIPEGTAQGTCETALTIRLALGDPQNPIPVAATVKKVGQRLAIVVDDADAARLSDSDADTLIDRFDRHIAPLSHQLFGEPTNNGQDRDGNGVVIAFFTSRLATAVGPNTEGIFFSDDLRPTSQAAHSNASDLLYLAPPGGTITLDTLSGTIGHEYQHLINFFAKVLINSSSQEDLWLDEGLATFAEDVLGYGHDAFENISLYLSQNGVTSLTGVGLGATEPDSFERRGMAHLLVRYLFEQRGGARFASEPGTAEDQGGIAAVRSMVQSSNTSLEALLGASRGAAFAEVLRKFIIAVALDGTPLSCLAEYGFVAPSIVEFTGFQRGIDLRTSVQDVQLSGPATATFEAETVPIPINGGEIRKLALPSGSTEISIAGEAGQEIVLVAIGR